MASLQAGFVTYTSVYLPSIASAFHERSARHDVAVHVSERAQRRMHAVERVCVYKYIFHIARGSNSPKIQHSSSKQVWQAIVLDVLSLY